MTTSTLVLYTLLLRQQFDSAPFILFFLLYIIIIMRFTSNDMSATCGFDVAWLLSYIIIVSTVYKSKLGSSVEAASERQESQPDVACRLAFSFTTHSSVFLDGEEKELIVCILLTRIVITTIRRNSCVISPPPQLVSSFLVHEELNRVYCGLANFLPCRKQKKNSMKRRLQQNHELSLYLHFSYTVHIDFFI